MNLIPDEKLQEYANTYVTGVPMTLFINADGEIIGDAIIGKQGMNAYLSALTSRMENTSGGASSALSDEATDQKSDELPENEVPTEKIATPLINQKGTALPDRMDQLKSLMDLSGTIVFTAQTPFGDAIDSSIFADYDLTMINIWGTLCQPCIKEMPDIQRLYEDIEPQGVNVIGFIANYQDDRVEKAAEILKAQEITYSNVVFDDDTSGAISAQIPGYPTTIFVDSSGHVVGEQLSGAHSYEDYAAAIQERWELDKK